MAKKTKVPKLIPDDLSSKLAEHFRSLPPAGAAVIELNQEAVRSDRDLFAMAALEGDWASQSNESGHFDNKSVDEILEDRARLYYRMADAMLKVRDE